MWLVAGLALTFGAMTLVYREAARVRLLAREAQVNLARAQNSQHASALDSLKSAEQLKKLGDENASLKARIAELESKIGVNASPAGGGLSPSPSR